MPKKKITEIVRTLSKPVAAVAPSTAKTAPVKTTFENKAGKYELIRVDGGQAYYSFTNRREKTVDAAMSVIMWQRMQERADAALEETA